MTTNSKPKGAPEFAADLASATDRRILEALDEVSQLGAHVVALGLDDGPDDLDEDVFANTNAKYFAPAFMKLGWALGIIRANVKSLHALHEEARAQVAPVAQVETTTTTTKSAITADGAPPMNLAKAAAELAQIRSHLRILRNVLESEEDATDTFNVIFELEERLAPVEEAVELAGRGAK